MRLRRIAALGLVCAAALSGCEPRPDHVTLGIALGVSVRPAIRLAVDTINEEGGIRGVPLRVQGLDWNDPGFHEPDTTLDWAEFLAGRADVMGLIGHSDSSATLAAASLYNDRGIPHVVTIATHPDITRVGPWTFRISIDDARQGLLLARHAVRDWGKRRIAVFYVNDDYGRGLSEHFQNEAEALGATIVDQFMHRNEPTPEDEELIRQTLAGWAGLADRPDLMVFLNRPPAVRSILRARRDLGLDTPALGADNTALMLGYGADHALIEGMRVSSLFQPDPNDLRAAAPLSRLADVMGGPPNYDAVFAYDAVLLLARAIEIGGFRREGVREALERLAADGTVLDGLGGRYALGPDRNAIRAIHIVELRDGEVRAIGTYRD